VRFLRLPPLLEVETLSGVREVMALASVVLAVINADHAPADHLEAVALDDRGGRLVEDEAEDEAEELGVRLDHGDGVVLAVPAEEVLVDGDPLEMADRVSGGMFDETDGPRHVIERLPLAA
jgi:hypothetical protein